MSERKPARPAVFVLPTVSLAKGSLASPLQVYG